MLSTACRFKLFLLVMKLTKLSLISFIFYLILQICNGCVNQKASRLTRTDKQLRRFYSKNNIRAQVRYFSVNSNTIRAIRVGDTTLPYFLMIHGSPGSNMDYDAYIKDTTFTNKYCIVLCDRPGYGYSNWGQADTSVLNQSKVILQALKPWLQHREFTILGNSYGGPIAATMAVISHGKAKKVILVASAMAPGEEKVYGISKTIVKPGWKWAFPTLLYLPSIEKLSHKQALQSIAPLIKTYNGTLLILHGTADQLVYYSNVNYSKNTFIKAKELTCIDFPGQGHPILWNSEERVKKLILDFMDR